MKNYVVTIEYVRPSGDKAVKVEYDVEARNRSQAVLFAVEALKADRSRKISRVTHTSARIDKPETSAPAPAPAPAPDNRPPLPGLIGVGDVVTVTKPRQYRVLKIEKDAAVVKSLSTGWQGRIPREAFERDTGRQLAPAAPVITTRYRILYPDGKYYTGSRPYGWSSYGIENLIQYRETLTDGVVTAVELVS